MELYVILHTHTHMHTYREGTNALIQGGLSIQSLACWVVETSHGKEMSVGVEQSLGWGQQVWRTFFPELPQENASLFWVSSHQYFETIYCCCLWVIQLVELYYTALDSVDEGAVNPQFYHFFWLNWSHQPLPCSFSYLSSGCENTR